MLLGRPLEFSTQLGARHARRDVTPVVQAVSKELVAAMLDSLERFTSRT